MIEGSSYEQMDKEVRDELLSKLLQEQGHICAYCMKRIPETRELPMGVKAVTIEHWLPRNPEDKLDIGQGLNSTLNLNSDITVVVFFTCFKE